VSEQIFKVGFVDEHFPGCWPSSGAWTDLHRKPKEAAFGNGIFLAARERAAFCLPSVRAIA